MLGCCSCSLIWHSALRALTLAAPSCVQQELQEKIAAENRRRESEGPAPVGREELPVELRYVSGTVRTPATGYASKAAPKSPAPGAGGPLPAAGAAGAAAQAGARKRPAAKSGNVR